MEDYSAISEIFHFLQKQIYEFCLKWKISEMALFGSVLSKDFGPDSDIDVLVSFKDEAGWGLFDFV